MITFYKVTWPSWLLGKFLVRVPFYSMVNLVAGRAIVPEFMQEQMTADNLATATLRLLGDEAARAEMRTNLAEVRRRLSTHEDPPRRAAAIIQEILEGQVAHVS
jgi:lipid-A-disaccharide synthase